MSAKDAENKLRVLAQNAKDAGGLSDEEFDAYQALKWLLDPDGDGDSRMKVITLATMDAMMTYRGRSIPLFSQRPGRTARMMVWQELRRRMRPLADRLDHSGDYQMASLAKTDADRRMEEDTP